MGEDRPLGRWGWGRSVFSSCEGSLLLLRPEGGVGIAAEAESLCGGGGRGVAKKKGGHYHLFFFDDVVSGLNSFRSKILFPDLVELNSYLNANYRFSLY